jgi:hypothetical protein
MCGEEMERSRGCCATGDVSWRSFKICEASRPQGIHREARGQFRVSARDCINPDISSPQAELWI